jgi:large subunit ribosomal protein L22
MGSRKEIASKKRKEENKTKYFARLRNCPTSPRKMRLVCDLIRGMDVNLSLDTLKYTEKEAAGRLYKLVKSAIANFENKSGLKADESELFIKEIFVDSAAQLKRIRSAPQGRAHRIRKRSNHVTVVLESKTGAGIINNNENIENAN